MILQVDTKPNEVCVGSFCSTLPLTLGQPNIFSKKQHIPPHFPNKQNVMNISNGRTYKHSKQNLVKTGIFSQTTVIEWWTRNTNIWVNLWRFLVCQTKNVNLKELLKPNVANQFPKKKNISQQNLSKTITLETTGFWHTPPKSNLDPQNCHVLKGVTFSKAHHFGYPAVSVQGFWHSQKQLDKSIILSYTRGDITKPPKRDIDRKAWRRKFPEINEKP